jgi:hypothetical protein
VEPPHAGAPARLNARSSGGAADPEDDALVARLAGAFAAEPARAELLRVIDAMVDHARRGYPGATSPFAATQLALVGDGGLRFTWGLGESLAYAFLLSGLGERARAEALVNERVDAIRSSFDAMRAQQGAAFDPGMRAMVEKAIAADRERSRASCEIVETRRVLETLGFPDAQRRFDAGWRGWHEGRA